MQIVEQTASAPRTEAMPYAAAFRPLPADWHTENLKLQGKVPSWLRGSLYRDGSSEMVGAPPFKHLFDGPALLQRFRFEDGKVFYTSRHLASTLYKGLRDRGLVMIPSYGTPPDHPLPGPGAQPPGYVPNANVHVGFIGGALVALTDGDPTLVEFHPQTLETGAPMRFDDDLAVTPLPRSTTAHFHFDFFADAAVNFYAELGPQGGYVIHATRRGERRRRIIARYRTHETSSMHSFALTENYAILLDSPMKNPEPEALAELTYAEALHWKPDTGTRFLVFRKSDGALAAVWEADAFVADHQANAFEHGGDIVIDCAAYDGHAFRYELYLDPEMRARHGVSGYPNDRGIVQQTHAQFRRYHLRAGHVVADYELLTDSAVGFPTVDYRRCNGRPYRIAYASGFASAQDTFYNHIVRVDTVRRSTRSWHLSGQYPGEPVFVGKGNPRDPDDGALLTLVFDAERATSYLLVLDATSLEEVGRADLPRATPLSFHGAFFPDL
jgi:beta,beta-carotene 9',10'-dioxygenase